MGHIGPILRCFLMVVFALSVLLVLYVLSVPCVPLVALVPRNRIDTEIPMAFPSPSVLSLIVFTGLRAGRMPFHLLLS